ncbi:hypothetical protein POV27_06375 [Aureisphaera galaxeae]|uniref:hypothetical protein n=1 Tax=Aureisphaera galaxeae TaxID=1538023 RepID=UPI00235055F7|nr:hypothetical protein [Aureisphaera galaxeae]MDC8003670.1 hypothetical protein [Aureisphaera galaxeae]
MTDFAALYKSLQERKRPEDVAEMILEVLSGQLSNSERRILERAAKGSLKRYVFGYTSMLQEFSRAVGANKQINKAIEIFELESVENINGNHAPDIENFLRKVSPLIHKEYGRNNFVADRLNKYEREAKGMDISKRNYNKKWRLIKRLENKLLKFQREQKKVEFQMIAKHGIVHRLDFEEFKKDKNTACFIAYFNARCNLRSVFTNKSQARAYDEISDMLFKRCQRQDASFLKKMRGKRSGVAEGKTNWFAISHIYTSKEVLDHLSEVQKGWLLGKWTTILQEIAELLGEVWSSSSMNRATMIVRRGNDSTTWNNTAGAWNKARDHWMNLIYAMGMDFILDDLCFGKVMRLMAADVASWHHFSGGGLDPNTAVWNDLPLPWEVFKGQATCNKQMVIASCRKVSLDPEKSGWIAPRTHGVEKFTPTPELVHGVQVANAYLATVLKKHKFYSGKKAKIYT